MENWDLTFEPGFEEKVALLLAALDDGRREWRSEIGTPSIQAIQWQPTPDGYSIGALMLHMISCELFWLNGLLGRELPEADKVRLMTESLDVDEVKYPLPPAQPIEWYFAMQDEYRLQFLELVREINDPDRVLTSKRGNQFTLRWVLAHLIQHDSYHGGQCVMLHELWKTMKS